MALLKKITASLVAGLTTAALILFIGNGGNIPWFPPALVFSLVAIILVAAIIFPFIWHYLEKQRITNNLKISGIINSIIRFGIAFNMAGFGWKKIMGLQFLVPTEIASQPMNQQTGEWLTWFYFGFSPVFGYLIAIFQLLGAWLILSRKTLTLGLMMLFALMLNLTLINLFYQMNIGALLQSLIITIAIAYLMALDFSRIKAFLFNSLPNIATINISNALTKNILRFTVLIATFLFTIYLKALMN